MNEIKSMRNRLVRLIITQSLYPCLDLSGRIAAMRTQIRLRELSQSKRAAHV